MSVAKAGGAQVAPTVKASAADATQTF